MIRLWWMIIWDIRWKMRVIDYKTPLCCVFSWSFSICIHLRCSNIYNVLLTSQSLLYFWSFFTLFNLFYTLGFTFFILTIFAFFDFHYWIFIALFQIFLVNFSLRNQLYLFLAFDQLWIERSKRWYYILSITFLNKFIVTLSKLTYFLIWSVLCWCKQMLLMIWE
jgi:hypothetical protein